MSGCPRRGRMERAAGPKPYTPRTSREHPASLRQPHPAPGPAEPSPLGLPDLQHHPQWARPLHVLPPPPALGGSSRAVPARALQESLPPPTRQGPCPALRMLRPRLQPQPLCPAVCLGAAASSPRRTSPAPALGTGLGAPSPWSTTSWGLCLSNLSAPTAALPLPPRSDSGSFLPPASAILHAAENFLEGRVLTTCPLLDYVLP